VGTHDTHALLPIGEFAARAGVAASALRFYESLGLIRSVRTSGNQRRYRRGELRRVAFIRAAQSVGLSLDEVKDALARLPEGRIPDRADWERLSSPWRQRLEDQIARLRRLQEDLDGCIGCGCLSLDKCAMYNRDDVLAEKGPGPRLGFAVDLPQATAFPRPGIRSCRGRPVPTDRPTPGRLPARSRGSVVRAQGAVESGAAALRALPGRIGDPPPHPGQRAGSAILLRASARIHGHHSSPFQFLIHVTGASGPSTKLQTSLGPPPLSRKSIRYAGGSAPVR
jgi:MerR family transcriptional regulator, redox-sensitive transcriptional activator SoxR